ncbi:unnamed protein product, partial [Didymodactylos carnosus]
DEEDELEFRKGEILNVLIENPNGLMGWMLCEKNGQCGICPGNRLRLLSSITTPTTSTTMNNSRNKNIISSKSMSSRSSSSSSSQVYEYVIPLNQYRSEYDMPSIQYDYDIPISAHENDYDIPRTATITETKKIESDSPTTLNSSSESSSRSSGIYSTSTSNPTDISKCSSQYSLIQRSKSSDTYITDKIPLDEFPAQFRKLSIRSLLPDKFRELLLVCDELLQSSSTKFDQFSKLTTICFEYCENGYQFLSEYGCLFDRHTYKQFKDILIKIEHSLSQFQQNLRENNNVNDELISQIKYFSTLSKDMFNLIRSTIELKIKQKHDSISTIPIETLKKLNLKPIATNYDENGEDDNKQLQLQSSVSMNSVYDTIDNSKTDSSSIVNSTRPLLNNSKTCHVNLSNENSYYPITSTTSSTSTSHDKKRLTDTYDYIEDDYSTTTSETDTPSQSSDLLKYYYRHINEQIDLMKLRYDKLIKRTKRRDGLVDSSYDNCYYSTTVIDRSKQLTLDEAKKFIVGGHKLVFVIETLQQYAAGSTNTNILSILLTELCDSLANVVLFIKQIVNSSDGDNKQQIVNDDFKQKAQQVMNIVTKIKQHVNKM